MGHGPQMTERIAHAVDRGPQHTGHRPQATDHEAQNTGCITQPCHCTCSTMKSWGTLTTRQLPSSVAGLHSWTGHAPPGGGGGGTGGGGVGFGGFGDGGLGCGGGGGGGGGGEGGAGGAGVPGRARATQPVTKKTHTHICSARVTPCSAGLPCQSLCWCWWQQASTPTHSWHSARVAGSYVYLGRHLYRSVWTH